MSKDVNEQLTEKLQANYQTFTKLCKNLGERCHSVSSMINHFDDRLVMCPASSRYEYHNACAGGLIDHSLRVLMYAQKIVKAFDIQVDNENLIMSCLFHDWGKIGSCEEAYYLNQTNDFYFKKGHPYEINREMQYMKNVDRTTQLFNHFNVSLTEEEFLAIRLNDGPVADENKAYAMQEPLLAVVVHQADRMACYAEKGRKSILSSTREFKA